MSTEVCARQRRDAFLEAVLPDLGFNDRYEHTSHTSLYGGLL
jgi:hypothetical protein